ncbi:MAG: hypothetical protein WDM77_02375 [Steroidobacteraceae bacterium]
MLSSHERFDQVCTPDDHQYQRQQLHQGEAGEQGIAAVGRIEVKEQLVDGQWRQNGGHCLGVKVHEQQDRRDGHRNQLRQAAPPGERKPFPEGQLHFHELVDEIKIECLHHLNHEQRNDAADQCGAQQDAA